MAQTSLDLAKPKAPPADIQKKSFADLVRSKVATVLVGKKADDFVTALISLMNQDLSLKNCDQMSLVASALQAQSLNLSLNRQLGQAWIVPFEDRKNKRTMATFQIGYKGYIQLAIRSGNYRKINVLAIKEGELQSYDPLNEELHINLIQDDEARERAATVGYYAMFDYLNGFRKCMYWSRAKMEMHGMRYSPAFKRDREKGSDYSFWSKSFDDMAYKTMIRQILSKWGIMSVEMQQAYEADMRVVAENGDMGDVVDADYTEAPAASNGSTFHDPDTGETYVTLTCPDGTQADPAKCAACKQTSGCNHAPTN